MRELIKKALSLVCAFGILYSFVPSGNVAFSQEQISISPLGTNCIFTKEDDIECALSYPKTLQAELSVVDYYGKSVLKKTLTDLKFQSENISIGRFDTGWYKIMLKAGAYAASSSFVVVPDSNNMNCKSSPFSSDLAANSILKSENAASDYAYAAKKAGLNTVRERYSWWTNDYSGFESAIYKESEAGLDVIAVSSDYSHGGYLRQKDMFTDDLFNVYDFQKNISSYFKDKVDAWEICNEMDHDNFGEIPSDVYSSFYKAAAIAVKDSGSGSLVMFGGLCLDPSESDFSEMMIKNDVMRYSDAYNIHRHLPAAYTNIQAFDTDFVKKHENLMLKSGYNRPIWVTEAGLAMSYVNDNNLKKQARYAVTSAVESISAGTDRHFWFILPQFKTGGKYEYGVFDEKNQPNPAYASLAVMTNILGKGEYKGRLNWGNIYGYVFNNGKNDVLVAWADGSVSMNIEQSHKVYDLMGNELNGNLKIGYDPVYLVFDDKLDTSLYNVKKVSDREVTKPFDEKDRIVIQADCNGLEDLKNVRNNGYLIGDNERRTVKLRIYNFNDSAFDGVLKYDADCFDISFNTEKVTIPSKSSITVEATIKPNDKCVNKSEYVSFYVESNKGNTSPTVIKFIKAFSVQIDAKNTKPDRVSGGFYSDNRGIGFSGGVIDVSLSNPTANPYNLMISDEKVNFISSGQYVDYEVNAAKDGAYYINFERENDGNGNFFIFAEVNGKTVNRLTGRNQNIDGSFVFQNEVYLNKGKNIIRVGNMSDYSGKLKKLSLKMLDNIQYTESINTAQGTRTFKDAYKTSFNVNPWLFINDNVSKYPEESNAPFVIFETQVLKSGYYYPTVAMAGTNGVNMIIDGECVLTSNDCLSLDEIYKASGTASCTWKQGKNPIFLKAGTHEIKLCLFGAKGTKWDSKIGAVRFTEFKADAYDGDFKLDLSNAASLFGAEPIGNSLYMSAGDWAEYEVYVTEDSSYYITFSRDDKEVGKSFYISVSSNGKTINRRTGRIKNSDGSYTFENEIELKKGKNTIRIETMGQNCGILSSISFKKLTNLQYTVSLNSASGGQLFKSSYKDGLTVDPWLWINDDVSDYPDGDWAPFITLELYVSKSGYYYPSVAASGVNKIKMNVDGEDFSINDYCTVLDELFVASGFEAATCKWLRSNSSIYLEKGRYDVTVKLCGASGGKWNTSIGAVRLIEKPSKHTENIPIWAEYDINVPETGTYSIRAASGGSSRFRIVINGSEMSYKTGSNIIGNCDSYTKWNMYENVAALYKGTNTVRIEPISNDDMADLIISEIVCIKTDDVPKIGITAKALTDYDTNTEITSTDPWAYIDVQQAQNPYIRWNYEIPDTGYYKVKLAFGGASKPKICIAENEISFEKATKTDKYCLYDTLGRFAPWYEADDVVYLEKGVYEVKMSLIDGYLNGVGKWQMGFAGFQLVEIEKAPIKLNVSACKNDNFLYICYQAAKGESFDIIAAEYGADGTLKQVYDKISVSGDDSVGTKSILCGGEDSEYEIYAWDDVFKMNPVLNKLNARKRIIRLKTR